MSRLLRGAKLAFEWLSGLKAGDVVTTSELLRRTGWSESSLRTYLNKNKLAPFVVPIVGGKLKILKDGSSISEQYFHEVFTQTAPKNVVLSVGDQLDGDSDAYLLSEPVGQGAVGHVWSAKVLKSRPIRQVAIKIMLPRQDLLAASQLVDVRERFRRESDFGRQLSHPNVVRYLDKGSVDRNPFLVMERAERSIKDDIRLEGKMTIEDASDVISSCVDALIYLESRGVHHRDIKPDNILRFTDVYKIGDLGIVRWGDLDPHFKAAGTITRDSVQLGSWLYMAPEQQSDAHDADSAADVYALGVTFIELLSGVVPTPHAIGARAFADPSDDPGLNELIRHMVSFAAHDRPSLAEIKARLT